MRILFLAPWYPDERQPVSGTFIKTHVQALAQQHEVVVISAKVDNQNFSFSKYSISESHNGLLHEYRLVISRSLPFINQLHHLLITFRVSKQISAKHKFDLVHSFIGYPGAIWGWMMSCTLQIPFVHTEHTKLSNNYRSIWHKKLTQFGMQRADKLTAVSNWLADQIRKDISRNVVVIPNMIDTDRFSITKNPKSEILQIGFLGGMNTDVKGLDILLSALSRCTFAFHLHIGGDGVLKREYMALIKQLKLEDHCTFYGFIPYEAISGFYNKLDFFVCSSRYETFNVSIVEAMASGLPILSTKCGGPEEIIEENMTGALVEKESIQHLAQGLQLMALNYSNFNSFKIKDYAKAKYSPQVIAHHVERVYKQLLSGKKDPDQKWIRVLFQ